MDGFGNTSGFSTTFGASPFREKLTGYEDIYGEQLGQPALNNLKAPEIEAYKNALTDSPDFEPFMQQRKRVLDLATKAVGAGMNIQNPRTEEEVQYALLFNQEVEKYNQLGRQLEDQSEVRKQFLPNVGKEGVVAVMPQQWNTQGFVESVQRVPTPQDIRLAFPNMRFTTQEEVDEFNTFVPQMLDQMGLSYEALKNPALREEVQRQFNVSKSFAGRGSLDREKIEEQRQKNFALQTARINANKPSGGVTPEPPDILSAWQRDLTSSDSNNQINAIKFVGLENIPIIEVVDDDEKKYTPQSVVPLFSGTQPLNVSVLSTDADLLTKMQQGDAKWENGTVLYRSNTGEWKPNPRYKHRLLTYREAYKQMEEAVAQKKTTYSGEKLGTKGGVGVLGTQPSTETDLSEIF